LTIIVFPFQNIEYDPIILSLYSKPPTKFKVFQENMFRQQQKNLCLKYDGKEWKNKKMKVMIHA